MHLRLHSFFFFSAFFSVAVFAFFLLLKLAKATAPMPAMSTTATNNFFIAENLGREITMFFEIPVLCFDEWQKKTLKNQTNPISHF